MKPDSVRQPLFLADEPWDTEDTGFEPSVMSFGREIGELFCAIVAVGAFVLLIAAIARAMHPQ